MAIGKMPDIAASDRSLRVYFGHFKAQGRDHRTGAMSRSKSNRDNGWITEVDSTPIVSSGYPISQCHQISFRQHLFSDPPQNSLVRWTKSLHVPTYLLTHPWQLVNVVCHLSGRPSQLLGL